MTAHDVPVHLAGGLRSQAPGQHALEAVHQRGDGHRGWVVHQQVHVIVCAVQVPQRDADVTADLPRGVLAAMFVVEREAAPLPACDREVGVDLGLASLAVTSDGEVIPNPRFLRQAQRRLRKAQRVLSRRQKGSANRARARHRVAVLHRTVRETRLDHAHKTALRLVRDNQAVYAEDLAVSGLMRTKLARSVADAGWSQLIRCVEDKAAQYGRTFARIGRIGRFEPTSQVCWACGVKDGPKPLSVREWACAACGTVHDRDVNAAKNILAAGRADNPNACGAGARPHLAAAGAEAGTHRGAA